MVQQQLKSLQKAQSRASSVSGVELDGEQYVQLNKGNIH
jgi:hypothetical protein